MTTPWTPWSRRRFRLRGAGRAWKWTSPRALTRRPPGSGPCSAMSRAWSSGPRRPAVRLTPDSNGNIVDQSISFGEYLGTVYCSADPDHPEPIDPNTGERVVGELDLGIEGPQDMPRMLCSTTCAEDETKWKESDVKSILNLTEPDRLGGCGTARGASRKLSATSQESWWLGYLLWAKRPSLDVVWDNGWVVEVTVHVPPQWTSMQVSAFIMQQTGANNDVSQYLAQLNMTPDQRTDDDIASLVKRTADFQTTCNQLAAALTAAARAGLPQPRQCDCAEHERRDERRLRLRGLVFSSRSRQSGS